jgi:hypothetical protein
MLKTDTKVDERDANQDAREVTNVLGEANNDLMQYQNLDLYHMQKPRFISYTNT